MDLLLSLGLNQTFAFQFIVFTVVFTLTYILAFKPYYLAYDQRQQLTIRDLSAADKIREETKELTERYEKKAKQLNSEFKRVYDLSRAESRKEVDEIIHSARSEAKTFVDKAREDLNKSYQQAHALVEKESEALSEAISNRVLNSERLQ